ncbi:GIY-YIG nuclease family protein [Rhizobium rhizogenes]|uniref:GIY-YIG nuclease family protein n=1 Tax=Rhizobium rhizogenes TaxID=359 RepID=UPI0015718597|nr:GIY-YIG nuclease family protein [Rhizobium rhizogenes]NTH22812.1 GIY-YIG nuclease family protein [Rhizobium rhizogenes]NTH35841.1 GIY-YIG nuclease family protein [Rhizobium rhizogenes]
MPEMIDYLNDELLLTPDDKPKAARTPLLLRAIEVIERINSFIDETGAAPVSEPGRSVQERMLANELAGLRASKSNLDGLAPYDTRKLLFGEASTADPLDDPLLSDGLDIFKVRDELKPMARPDFVADRHPCLDFERFEPLFDRIRKAVDEGARKPQPFRQERVEIGEFFVLKGQLVHVADLRDEHRRNGKPDARLRVIFDNGTESNLLMSSLVRRLYEDKDARRIGMTDAGPLFKGARTGFVYVLRSRSDKPEVQGLLKVGTTSGAVEDRIAHAETQSTFLFAPVEILITYELVGHSAKEAEQLIHRALRPYHMALRVTGPDGRSFSATEWFRMTPELVENAINKALA